MEEQNVKNDRTDVEISKVEPLFKELNVDDVDSEITEIDSLCLRCGKNGITKLLLTKIPFYKDVVIMSFACPHCHWENNELQPVAVIQEKGIMYDLRVTECKDLNRQVVKTEWASIIIPEIEFEIPSQSQEGCISSIEGIIQRAIDGLQTKLDELIESSSSTVKLQEFLNKFQSLKNVDVPFHFILRDTSGNSFLENIYSPKADPEMEVSHFERSRDENIMLGVFNPEESNNDHGDEVEKLKDEVLEFPTNCHYCNAPCVTNMKDIDIPHFKSVVVMVTVCGSCGQKTNEVQSSSGIEPHGLRITLKIDNVNDLKRDLLKSDTCSVKIPELDLEVGASAISGRYTTVEGLLANIKESLQNNPFAVGDTANVEVKKQMLLFLEKINEITQLKRKVTLILDDPCGHSFLQSMECPEPGTDLTIEKYERTFEQNEELGLNHMKVENYEET